MPYTSASYLFGFCVLSFHDQILWIGEIEILDVWSWRPVSRPFATQRVVFWISSIVIIWELFKKFRISGKTQDLLNQNLVDSFSHLSLRQCILMFLKVQFLYLYIRIMLQMYIWVPPRLNTMSSDSAARQLSTLTTLSPLSLS